MRHAALPQTCEKQGVAVRSRVRAVSLVSGVGAWARRAGCKRGRGEAHTAGKARGPGLGKGEKGGFQSTGFCVSFLEYFASPQHRFSVTCLGTVVIGECALQLCTEKRQAFSSLRGPFSAVAGLRLLQKMAFLHPHTHHVISRELQQNRTDTESTRTSSLEHKSSSYKSPAPPSAWYTRAAGATMAAANALPTTRLNGAACRRRTGNTFGRRMLAESDALGARRGFKIQQRWPCTMLQNVERCFRIAQPPLRF